MVLCHFWKLIASEIQNLSNAATEWTHNWPWSDQILETSPSATLNSLLLCLSPTSPPPSSIHAIIMLSQCCVWMMCSGLTGRSLAREHLLPAGHESICCYCSPLPVYHEKWLSPKVPLYLQMWAAGCSLIHNNVSNILWWIGYELNTLVSQVLEYNADLVSIILGNDLHSNNLAVM